MPELPEVQTIVNQLAPLRDARIAQVSLAREDIVLSGDGPSLPALLRNREITAIAREGKRILLHLHPAGRLVIHLGMSGRLTVEPPDAAVPVHTHLRIGFSNRPRELRFRDPRRFGGVWFFNGDAAASAPRLGMLGPDALTIRVPALRAILQRRRQVKALLLDQTIISGLGNIYADEALHRAGIHPLAQAGKLTEPQVRALACSIRKTLHAAIRSKGSTLSDYRQADGSEGAFQRLHRVYGRDGEPCRCCGRVIVKIVAAGRGTHLCPTCQPRRSGKIVRG